MKRKLWKRQRNADEEPELRVWKDNWQGLSDSMEDLSSGDGEDAKDKIEGQSWESSSGHPKCQDCNISNTVLTKDSLVSARGRLPSLPRQAKL